jgi:hypothetical protein
LALKKVLKFAKSCKNTIYLLICKKCLLFRCHHLSYNNKFKFDQSVSAIHDSPPQILRSVSMTTHSTPLVTHAHDH